MHRPRIAGGRGRNEDTLYKDPVWTLSAPPLCLVLFTGEEKHAVAYSMTCSWGLVCNLLEAAQQRSRRMGACNR